MNKGLQGEGDPLDRSCAEWREVCESYWLQALWF